MTIESVDRIELLKLGETPNQPSPTIANIKGKVVSASSKLIAPLAIKVNFIINYQLSIINYQLNI
jgi:propanediol dehydratase large subunit